MSKPPPELVTALQRALAGEHAALYAYEVIGGRLDADTAPQRHAVASYRHHRSRRDDLTARLRRHGQAPAAAEPGYDLPFEVDNAKQAARLARHVEQRCTTLYAQVVAAARGQHRHAALQAMTWSARQELAWGGSPSALPGVGSR